MSIRTTRLAALLTALVAGAALSGGCTGDTAVSTDEAAPASVAPAADRTPAPTSSERGPLTGQELLWLQAVEQLLPTMNKVFDDIPTNVTPAAMRSMAYQARSCSRALIRIGAPSARLQPIEDLVRQACREYDKGATCFDAAARLGTPSSSSEIHKLEQQLSCGMAAAETGGKPLAEAQIKVYEVRAAATGSR